MLTQKVVEDVNSALPAGYRAGSTQPSVRTQMDIMMPATVDFSRLGNTLRDRFGIELTTPDSRIQRNLSSAELAAQEFVSHMMALALELLNAIRIPCFASGILTDLVTVDEARQMYRASFLFPAIEHISQAWIVRCLIMSRRLLADLARPELTDEATETLLEALHEKFVVEARKQIPGGDSTIPVLKTAFGLGIPFLHLGAGIYQLGWGAKRRMSDRSATDLDAAIGASASQNKLTAAQLLRQAGLPVPVHGQAASLSDAIALAEKIGFPVVVKPADRDRGEGVTVGIENNEALAKAFEAASAHSKNILVERQIPGLCHRILVAGDAVVYSVGRLPMGVEGDGQHTVRELITSANKTDAQLAKHRRKKPLPCDELAEQTLLDNGLQLDVVPAKGQFVKLRPIESTEWGGLPDVSTDRVHPDNRSIAIAAARCMDLHVAGVDLITTDISRPWYENDAVINEINFAPFLGMRLAYQREGVVQLMRRLFEHGTRIPIEAFIGGDAALAAADRRMSALRAEGIRAFLTTHSQTRGDDGDIRFSLWPDGLFARCRALLVNPQVEAILMVIQTDEFLSTGLPVDTMNEIHVSDRHLLSATEQTPLASPPLDELIDLLRLYQPRPDTTARA